MRSPLRHPQSVVTPVITGCVYFAMATLALYASRFEGGLAFIWAANALLMAELLSSEKRYWPRVIIACGIASAISTSLFGMGPAAAAPMAVINIAESLIVAMICRHFASQLWTAGSTGSLSIFIFALCGPANMTAAIGAALVASQLTAVSFGASWLQWYTGHVLGGLICVPILMLLLQGEFARWMRTAPVREKVEAAGLLVAFALIATHVFYFARYPMLFALLLPLVVIAFRLGHLGSAASIVILAVIGGAATFAGYGPLHMVATTMGQCIQFLQIYLAFCFLLSVPVAAELEGRRRLLQMLRASEARYRQIAEHSGDVVLNISVSGIIEYASPSAAEQIGLSPEQLIGQEVVDLVDSHDRAIVVAAHQKALAQPGDIQTVEFRPLMSAEGRDWCEMVTRAVLNERGATVGLISTIRDMSRHKAHQRELQQVAAIDSLTGADTRRAFLEKLESEILRAGHGHSACLLLLDIDHFKTVNDRYGHGIGDRVLAGFVERLRPGLRGLDSVGRLGGEEFAILLSGTDIGQASLVCERLRAMVTNNPVWLDDEEAITVTFSAGLVSLNGKLDSGEVMELADKALYRAKHSGRNCLRLAA